MNLLWRYLAKFHSTNTQITSTVLSGLSSFAESGIEMTFM